MTALRDESLEAMAEFSARDLEHLEYYDRLRTLSEASVEKHFDAFEDIDWENPAYAIDPTDERWVLPEADVLGRHPWYLSLPLEERIRIGLYRQANVCKVGLQFEQILVAGIMNYSFGLPNGNSEFRYSTHEATEECHHTQMFQEFVNRSGQQVPGGTTLFRTLAPILPIAARLVPFGFFYGVLAGEEPIDHMQKAVLSVAVPVIMRWLCDEILVPSKQAQQDMGIPDWVMRELWWDNPESQKMQRDLLGDVRMLAEDPGIMNVVSRPLWNLLRIGGRPSRFRSEPASAAT